MRRIPPITAGDAARKRRRLPFQRRVTAAHDTLPKILEAVVQMPGRLLWHLVRVIRRHARVDLYDGVEAVQLVSHGCREDCGGIAVEWFWEVVVRFWVGDFDVA